MIGWIIDIVNDTKNRCIENNDIAILNETPDDFADSVHTLSSSFEPLQGKEKANHPDDTKRSPGLSHFPPDPFRIYFIFSSHHVIIRK